MPKSVPRLVLDKVRFVCSDLRYSTPILCPKLKFPIKFLYVCNIVDYTKTSKKRTRHYSRDYSTQMVQPQGVILEEGGLITKRHHNELVGTLNGSPCNDQRSKHIFKLPISSFFRPSITIKQFPPKADQPLKMVLTILVSFRW